MKRIDKSPRRSPILVTGAPRSGTTITGKLLGLPACVATVYEPMNVQIGLRSINRQFTYVRAGCANEAETAHAFDELFAGHARFRRTQIPGHANPLVAAARAALTSRTNVEYRLSVLNPMRRRWLLKDPIAVFASDWIQRRYDADVVATIRHPAATIASYRRLGWRITLRHLTSQPELMADHLALEFDGLDVDALSPIEEGAWLWRVTYAVISSYLDANPRMTAVRHEDLSSDPITVVGELYGHLGLDYTSRVRAKVLEYTGGNNPTDPVAGRVHTLHRNSRAAVSRWRKYIDEDELRVIRGIVEPVSKQWYSDDEW